MNILEQSKNEEFVKEQFIKGRILDDTKDYGRTQFVDEIYKLQQENQKLKDELKNKPDAQITLKDDKGNKFTLIQTERIDMQVELNKTIEKLFNNWNKLKEYIRKNIIYDDVGMKILDPSPLEDYIQELEQGSYEED